MPFLSDKTYLVGAVEEQLTGALSQGTGASAAQIALPASAVNPATWATDLPRDFTLQDGINAERILIASVGGSVGNYWFKLSTAYNSNLGLLFGYGQARASILTPGVPMTLTSANFNYRLRGIVNSPKITPDGESEKFATGDHGRDQSIMTTQEGDISFSEKVAVSLSAGAGLLLDITAVSGAITAAVIHSGANGTGYAVGDLLSVVQGGGAAGTVMVTSIGTAGAVLSIAITGAGTGYTTASSLAVTPNNIPTWNSFMRAMGHNVWLYTSTGITALVDVTASAGAITAAIPHVGNQGSGYAVGDLLLVAVGTGGLLMVASVNAGVPVTYSVIAPGTGYTTASSVATSNQMSGVGFRPVAAADETCMTIWVINVQGSGGPKGNVWKFSGCSGDGGLEGEFTKPYTLTGKFTGKFTGNAELTNAQLPLLTNPDITNPEKMLSNSCQTIASGCATILPSGTTIPGTALSLHISKFKLEFGNKISPVPYQKDPTGHDYYMRTEQDPRLTVNPLQMPVSQENVITNVLAQQTVGFLMQSALSNAHVSIDAPNAQLLSPSIQDEAGFITHGRTYRLLRNNTGAGAMQPAIPDECMYEILLGSR